MTGRRAIFGLCMLCVLGFSAAAAQGALAAGQTAFTCVSTAETKNFSSEHCVPGETGTSFGHVAITEETHAKFSNAKTNATTSGPENSIFKETIVGTNVELESTGAIEGLGTLKNVEEEGAMRGTGETDASGITFNGVIVKAPASKGCIVREDNGGNPGTVGVVRTRKLKGHTIVVTDKENGEGPLAERHSVLVEPATAGSNVLASFFIECTGNVPPEVKGLWTITGFLTCPTHGATIVCNHKTVTEVTSLKGKGLTAGFEGKATVTAGKFPVTEPTHAISVTTTTP